MCEICEEEAFETLVASNGAKLIVCEGCSLALRRGETVYDEKGHPFRLRRAEVKCSLEVQKWLKI